MKLLLDSHVILWHQEDDARLPRKISDLIANSEHPFCISIATFWELSIKLSLGKLNLPGGIQRIYDDWTQKYAAEVVTVKMSHLDALQSLPLIHRDPFDRILIAQAIRENLTLVSGDPNIRQYADVEVIW